MSNSATVDRPLPPRPLFHSLDAAIRCAIHFGTSWSDVIPERWAQTYQSTAEDVERAWKLAMTKIPPNSVDEIGDGK